jgi:hypothetical protein
MGKRKQPELPHIHVLHKFEHSNATVNELRTGIFAPIEKISGNSTTYKLFKQNNKKRTIKTSWGNTVIKGNILTQIHRDLIDCIFANSKEIKELDNGGIAMYFSTSAILDTYSSSKDGASTRNTQWLKSKLDEIQTTAIEFQTKDGKDFYSFSIISSFAYSSKHKSFGLVITPEYREYFEKQLSINYKSDIPKLLKVKSALLRAVIRFFWTHAVASTMTIEQLLATLGFPMESIRSKQMAVKEIKDNADLLINYGIFYEPKTKLIYKKEAHENDITFISPVAPSIEQKS